MEDKECNLSPCQQFVTFLFVLLLHNLTLFPARQRGSQCHQPQSIPTRHTSRLASPSNLCTLGKRLPSPTVAPHLQDVANAFAAEHANGPLHLPATCALVGSILGAELALPWARHCRNFCASREKRPPTSPALTTRRAISFAPQNSGYLSSSLCGSFRATPSFSSAFFKCEQPHGGRTPMSRPKPAAGRLRETGLPQQPKIFSSHSQSPAIVSKTNFHVEAPITSPRNDGFLNINLETWGHRSNSNISTSLFPQVLTLRRQPGCLTA